MHWLPRCDSHYLVLDKNPSPPQAYHLVEKLTVCETRKEYVNHVAYGLRIRRRKQSQDRGHETSGVESVLWRRWPWKCQEKVTQINSCWKGLDAKYQVLIAIPIKHASHVSCSHPHQLDRPHNNPQGQGASLNCQLWDLLSGPVVKALSFHCQGWGFDLWSRN